MKKADIYLGLILFFLGFAGVLTVLSMPFPIETIPEEVKQELLKEFTVEQLRWLGLINPLVLLLIAVIIGVVLHKKVGLAAPTIENLIQRNPWWQQLKGQITYGLAGGLFAGILLLLVYMAFQPFFPTAFLELAATTQMPVETRLLYGGITEEILTRFGLMTLLVWILVKITAKQNKTVYWIAIILAALIFGAGHLPLVFQMVADPGLSLISYIILGNSAGGIVFGWLYWKKGLEASIIAHMFAHVTMITAEAVFG